jgi:nucleoside-diphosphate-sugar epimerase
MEIIKTVIDLTGMKPEVVINKSHESGPSRMCADISLAKRKLGYEPRTSLEEGFHKILELDPRFKPSN